MRILFVSPYFYPEPNMFMGLPFAKALAERGHQVEALTGFPNYPGGKVFDGYRIRPLQREVLDGIPIIRVALYPSHDSSSLRRIITYSSFALTASTIGTAVVKPADVAYITTGPVTNALVGIALQFFRRIPFVFDIKDLWPDALTATGMFTNRFGYWLCDKWCNFAHRRADKIVASSAGYKQKLMERGVPEDKIETIYNWCDESYIAPVARDQKLAKELKMAGRFNIVFAGNMGKAQALDAVLDAAKILTADCPRVQFVFFGRGVEVDSLKQKAADAGLKNVLFYDRRPLSQVSAILALADVLLVHLKDQPVYRITVPGKTQAYLAAGRPILAAVGGDANDLVARAKAGLTCEPEDSRGIADAVRKFQAMSRAELDTMGANGTKFYKQELSFEIAVKKYEKLFESVARNSGKTN